MCSGTKNNIKPTPKDAAKRMRKKCYLSVFCVFNFQKNYYKGFSISHGALEYCNVPN